MAIVNSIPTVTIDSTVAGVKSITTRIYNTIKRDHTQAFNQIWNNPNFTAKQIVDAFGTDGLALFQLSSALQSILANADPNYVRLVPPLDFTINADGTVTIHETAIPA
jgi:hypothetical protein